MVVRTKDTCTISLRPSHSTTMLNAFFLSLVIWCIGLQAQLVARDDDLYASNFQVKTDSTPRTIHKLGIITKHVTPNQISEHQNTTRLRTSQNVKIFSNVALGYVTPWNKKGYDIAEKYRHKFDYISPIWYYIKPISPNIPMTYKLEGAHDVDQERTWLTSFLLDYMGRETLTRIVTKSGQVKCCKSTSKEKYSRNVKE
ncbi:hypothetical protein SeMB42_g03495 [Synchytrium endobioticum]|uniref:Uncharacterized protein n=1 Tax=Synchytrium endobioticum TaxID=286115 RepID=A0A507D6E4_9FUNG|nr:hypothetical protein SeMB42_g03495 [Synchytrium endobioticum]